MEILKVNEHYVIIIHRKNVNLEKNNLYLTNYQIIFLKSIMIVII